MAAKTRWTPLNWQDPFELDSQLSAEQRMVRDSTQQYAQSALAPRVKEAYRQESTDPKIFREMGEMGLLGATIDGYGCPGVDYVCYGVIAREIERVDSGYRSMMSVQSSLVMVPINEFGSEEQKQKYLPKLVSGEHVGALAMSEPNAGSDVVSMKLRADFKGDHYVLNGTKMWITNGPQADICVTYANKDPSMRHRGVSAFILEKGMNGFSVGKVEEKMGIACSSTSELIYEDVVVPEANLLFAEDKGFNVAMATLDGGRIGIAAQALGIAQRAFDLAVAHAKARVAFGKPIATKQAIQWMIADMGTRIEAARLLTRKAAMLKDANKHEPLHVQQARCGQACSMAKLYASETANFCADKAVQIHGGYGYSREYEVERLYRDARITTLYEGTSEIQRLVIAKSFLR